MPQGPHQTHTLCFTSYFAPIYSGVTKLTESWSRSPKFTGIDRTQIQWKFQLVGDLTCLKYQEAIKDVREIFEPAEERFLDLQPEFEDAAAQVFRKYGSAGAERFVTEYINSCLENIDKAYG